MTTYESPKLTFNDGRTIPQLGYGVWKVKDDVAEKVVSLAFDAGYRHVDTARIYGNEAGVGRAVAASGLDRSELFVTTKVWNADQGYQQTLDAFDASLERMGMDFVDLFLIHWLQPKQGKHVDTWKALIELQKSGRVGSIGVCNFTAEALQELEDATGVVPAVHQVETHPFFPQTALRQYEASRGILHQSWSPLGLGLGTARAPGADRYRRQARRHPRPDRDRLASGARTRGDPQVGDPVTDRGELGVPGRDAGRGGHRRDQRTGSGRGRAYRPGPRRERFRVTARIHP